MPRCDGNYLYNNRGCPVTSLSRKAQKKRTKSESWQIGKKEEKTRGLAICSPWNSDSSLENPGEHEWTKRYFNLSYSSVF